MSDDPVRCPVEMDFIYILMFVASLALVIGFVADLVAARHLLF